MTIFPPHIFPPQIFPPQIFAPQIFALQIFPPQFFMAGVGLTSSRPHPFLLFYCSLLFSARREISFFVYILVKNKDFVLGRLFVLGWLVKFAKFICVWPWNWMVSRVVSYCWATVARAGCRKVWWDPCYSPTYFIFLASSCFIVGFSLVILFRTCIYPSF